MATFRLTTNDDNITGTGGTDTLEVPNNNANLVGTDVVDLRAGHDTVVFERTTNVAFSYLRMAGFSGIDELDATAGSRAFFSISDTLVSQSDFNTLTITFDGDPLLMDLGDLTPGFGTVRLNGSGQVTLQDDDQAVEMSSGVSGQVIGGAKNDTITGNGGNDIFESGAGADVLTGGTGTNTLTGGVDTDRFVISTGETVTITDFEGSANYELIDLRAFAGVGFGDLTITANSGNARIVLPGDAATITLTGVDSATLSAADFLFDGQVTPQIFTLSGGADDFNGGAGNDIFDYIGANSQLDASVDDLDGGTGIDVLRVFGGDRVLGPARVDALTGIEVIDLTNVTGNLAVALDADNAVSSDTQAITVRFGSNALDLNTGGVSSASQVIADGSGTITLAAGSPGQMLTLGDSAGGTVNTGPTATVVQGGAQGDSITGSDGDDTFGGGAGDDTLIGAGGNDNLTGGSGTNRVSGGSGTDRFVVVQNETVTITDFEGSANYELIDLRAFAGVGFGDLTITANSGNARIVLPGDAATITLTGVDSATLSAADFIFDGQDAPGLFTLTGGADNFTGGSGGDLFDLVGQTSQLDASVDTLTGGAGIDVLRVFGSDRTLGEARLDAMTGIEVIDLMNVSGTLDISMDADIAASSDTQSITLRFGDNALSLNTAGVGSASQVIADGSGTITLAAGSPGQMLTLGDSAGGTVNTGPTATVVQGGAQGDSITGSDGDDTFGGGAGDDTLIGAGGNDNLTGGSGTNRVSGGSGTDRFVVVQNETVTITDFEGSANYELIDLRAFAGVGFGDLTITANSGNARIVLPGDAATITLTGVDSATLSAADFIFDGQDAPGLFTLTDGADNFTGGSGGDLFDLVGQTSQLDASVDTLTGGAGIDVLRVFGSDRTLGEARLDAMTGIEVIDLMNATGNHDINIDDEIATRSDTGSILVRFGAGDLALNTRSLDGSSGLTSPNQVVVEGTGLVTLASGDAGQMVSVSDSVGGRIQAGNDATHVIGGDQNDTLLGDEGFDTLQGGGGNDTLRGGNGNDTLQGGTGRDLLDGGEGDDRLYGGGNNDTILGGDGYDLIAGGAGANRVTGGDRADAFIVVPGETLTITDYDTDNIFERIDLRAIAGVSFGDLTITAEGAGARVTLPDGTRIDLLDVLPGTLSSDDFVFDGDPRVLFAEGLSAPADFLFTAGEDNFQGTAGNEIFDVPGVLSNLSGTEDTVAGGVDDGIFDRFDGGAGIDVLRIAGEDRSISPLRLEGMTGMEVIDLRGASINLEPYLSVSVNADMIAQSDNGKLRIRHGENPIFLDTSEAPELSVITEGTGQVTLRDVPGQSLIVSDLIPGNIVDGNDANLIVGGDLNDLINGMERADTLRGGAGNDTLLGGEGNDSLVAGAGDDLLVGGIGNDILIANAGANRLDGGEDFDQYVVRAGALGTVIADYDPTNFVERIDLTDLGALRSIADVTLTNVGSHVRVTADGLDLTIENVQANELDDGDFLFRGEDPLLFNVAPGTTGAQLQQLFDGAPAGAIIRIAAGTYPITETLEISRGDITVEGAGEGLTIFRTDIPVTNPGPTLIVHPDSLQDRYGQLEVELAEGSNQVQLPDVEALRLADPDQDFDDFEVGDLVFLFQPNDDAYLEATGNLNNPDRPDWRQPEAETELDAELYYLREFRSRIESIDENGIATLAEASPYTFAAGTANIARNTFLENVHLSDFSIEGNFEDDAGGPPAPFFFEDTIPEWVSIAALEFDGVRDSSMERITITDPAAHAFKWQRAHETTGDQLTAVGAHNKSGSSGYHFLLQESFANDLTNLSSTDSRHAILFSSYNAEHYNDMHLAYTNRDINFHGSADDENTILVDVIEQDYPAGSSPQWQAVHPGVAGLHPVETIEENDVTFRYARSGERSDRIVAHPDGGNIAMSVGSDEGIGGVGNDTINGEDGNDTLRGNDGNDILNGGNDQDFLFGGNDNDTLRGGQGNDRLFGGPGNDVINGGPNGDNLSGGAGQDIFLRLYDDFTDNILDFETGAGGDILRIRGSAYKRFNELRLEQIGDDVVLEFGPTGQTTFKNTQLADLVPENFEFESDSTPGQDQSLRATQMFAVGTDRGDTFRVSRAHMDEPTFAILAGAGYDTVVIAQSSLNTNLGATGSYSGVEEFGLSAIGTLGLVVDNPLVSQSSSGKLYLSIGDSGTPVLLDVGPLGRGKNVFIDGAREVRLTGGREHTVKSDDDVGTNIIGDDLRDIIYGGRANDSILGGSGNDNIFGSAGDDTLRGEAGNDTINGGPGSDLIYVEDAGDRVAESNRWDGHDTVIASVDFRMGRSHIEDLQLTGDARIGAGNGLQNRITGNDGDNILDGGKNNDTLEGGLGNDRYLVRAPGDTIIEQAGEGIDVVLAYRSYALVANVENLFMQTVYTKDGSPAIFNGIGNDLDNVIVGTPFANFMIGREGRDTLRGQAGADNFVFDREIGPDNVDRIIDFNTNEENEGDKLLMKGSEFGNMAAGALAESQFVVGTSAVDANDRFIFDQAAGRLWFDADGSGADDQVLIAAFDQNALVTASDIEIF
jgi:Ca2+-binding RTX toxin-like protein